MKIVIQISPYKVVDIGTDRRQVPTHIRRTQFGFGLALEDRFHDLYGNGRDNALANI